MNIEDRLNAEFMKFWIWYFDSAFREAVMKIVEDVGDCCGNVNVLNLWGSKVLKP